ncbi:3-phosphoshikimate 1-carboxyvinyltransferase [Gammaproteobacteria bacterium]|nr:3-phosphoshikimate 1-carboxyvinyltransferase [Gammaproteobacteria bacterium]
MNLITSPNSQIFGTVQCPGDKSISQRVLMIGALMNQEMTVDGFLHAEDPLSTMSALNQIGAGITVDKNGLVHLSKRQKIFQNAEESLNLGNSGTGLRLMLGLTSGMGLNLSFCGDESLSSRPMSRVIKPLTEMGANIVASNGMLPISLSSALFQRQYTYELPVASAQVKSSILLAGLAAGVGVEIIEPVQTRDHTERMLKHFGANVEIASKGSKNVIQLLPSNHLKAKDYTVVGDISSAAFLIVGALISNSPGLEITNVGMNPSRTGVLEALKKMGANIEVKNQRLESGEPCADLAVKKSTLKGVELSGDIIPNVIDEIPILSIAAAFAEGETVIRNAAELRVKESDRLKAVSDGFSSLGVVHKNFEDGMCISGSSDTLLIDQSVTIESHDDHRIAMSFLIAGLRCSQPIIVKDCKNIFTSFPNFIELTSSVGYRLEK